MILQAQQKVSDFLQNMGKMYVVIATIAVIFLLIVLYMVWLDQRIRRMEKKVLKE